ncbi:hypothetical protein BT63DRAFT_426003 [Microthyrium microscopicum]|uniref:DUF3669 domain-containing protein n=1 Tax=Microthyrium microscopicum TaxID=703497 RepID=A0A6A6UBM4_9PEZI|nr:hypothetical protein BT63DRAFT_426003 [Microthyrium microscopicum]
MEPLAKDRLREIGKGNCGSVWASSEANFCFKREDGGPGRSLHNDYIMHKKVLETLPAEATVQVPNCHEYIGQDDELWWRNQLHRFPKGRQPCNVLITERVPAFSKPVREKLIDLFCPETGKAVIYTSKADEDCIVRPYLGRRRQQRQLVAKSRLKAFGLRNYPLHIDQIQELNLDSAIYATIMADTLAQLFWIAHVDANDLEFVLAPPSSSKSDNVAIMESEILGKHVLWILDFDLCRDMSMDEDGVKQAVNAFLGNDPYYPRPDRDYCKELWTTFKNRFLETSQRILVKGPEALLPLLWVQLVEEKCIELALSRVSANSTSS